MKRKLKGKFVIVIIPGGAGNCGLLGARRMSPRAGRLGMLGCISKPFQAPLFFFVFFL